MRRCSQYIDHNWVLVQTCRLAHLLTVSQSVILSVCPEGVLWQNGSMPFGVVSGVSWGMGILDGVMIVKGAVLGVNVGNPIVTSGDFVVYLCRSVWTKRALVGGGEWSQSRDGCIDGGPCTPREGFFGPIGFSGIFLREMYSTHAWKVKNISLRII